MTTGSEPDAAVLRQYVEELRAMLRQRSPQAYRAFLHRWRDLHQRGVASRLAAMDDAALRWRIEHMILEQPELADLHESARAYLREHGPPGAPGTQPQQPPVRPRGSPGERRRGRRRG